MPGTFEPRSLIAAALLLPALGAAACQQQTAAPTGPGAPPAELTIGGPDIVESIGASITLTATLTQGTQSTDVTAAAQWVTNDPNILAVLGPGVISARASGGAPVFVTYQGRNAVRRVIVASAEDCYPYDPSSMFLGEGVSNGTAFWTLASPAPGGGFVLHVSFVDANDAQDGLALARQHSRSCHSGRNYGGADRLAYIVSYWDGAIGPMPTLNREDCDPYDRTRLEVRSESPGWTVFDGTTAVARLRFEEDAGRILVVARQHSARCFIGRGRTYSGGRTFATAYFR